MQEQSTATLFAVPEIDGITIASPEPGIMDESLLFKKIQEQFKDQFENAFPDKLAPKDGCHYSLTYA